MILEESEATLHRRVGEPRSQATEDVVGVIATAMDPAEFSSERFGIQESASRGARWMRTSGADQGDVARAGECPRPESDGGAVALAYGPDAHDEAN